MDYKAIATWALGHSTGASATCIARHMMGLPVGGDFPHDSGDFGRCEALLDAVPELRARLPEMAAVSAMWAKLVENWDLIREADDQFMFIMNLRNEVRNERAAASPRV